VKSWLAVLLWVGAALAEPVAVRVLDDFERSDALAAWDLDLGAHVDQGQAELNFRRRRVWQIWRDPWPSLRLSHGDGLFSSGDWRGYDRLEFAVENRSTLAVLLKLRVDDESGTRAIRLFSLSPQMRRTCRVDLGLLGREIDLHKVALIDLYMSHPVRDYALALDDIRLVADTLSVAGAEVLADPFGRGRVRVRTPRGRSAFYRAEIRDGQGEPVAEYAAETEQLDWTWSGGAPGLYRVVLSASDRAWPTADTVADLGAFGVLPETDQPHLVAWAAKSTRKVMRDDLPRAGQFIHTEQSIAAEEGRPLRLEVARNEVEALQLVFSSDRRVRLGLVVEYWVHQEQNEVLAPGDLDLFQVGYVFTRRPREYPVDFVGWWPDPLLPRAEFRARPGENQVVWLALRTGQETIPGTYRGRIGVWLDGVRLGALPLEVQVYDIGLPESTTVRTAFSLYEDRLVRVYGRERASALRGRYVDFVLDHRLNLDHLYRREPPDLDELAAYARQGRLNAFNLLYLDSRQDYDRAELETLAARLDSLVARIDELGLDEQAYIYGFDEVEVEEFGKIERVFSFIKERYPRLRTATTARDPGLGLDNKLGALVDIWVPLSAVYEARTAARARRRGDEVWWYICISPAHPYANWFIEYPALEARLLWWMAHERGIEGVLYYAMNRWPKQRAPLRADIYGRTYWDPASYGTANGDGALFYAGPDGPISSIRMENIRDGIEDYELLALLAARAGPEAARALSARLVRSASDYTRDPEAFALVRRDLLEAVSAEP